MNYFFTTNIFFTIIISICIYITSNVWAKDAELFIFFDHNRSANGDAISRELLDSTDNDQVSSPPTDGTDQEVLPREEPLNGSDDVNPLDILDCVDVKDEDVVALLSRIARQVDWHLNVGEIGEIKVDLQMKKLHARDAVQVVCDQYDLVCLFEGPQNKILRVMLTEEYEEEFGRPFERSTLAEIVSLQYLDFMPVQQVLKPFLSESGRMIGQGQRRFIVIDHPDNLGRLKGFIQQIDKPLMTKEISLKYVSVDDIVDKVAMFLTPTVATCSIDKELNTMTIVDFKSVVRDISRFVETIDHRSRGIIWDLNVYQVLLSHAQQKGIDWEAIVSDYQEFTARQIRPDQDRSNESILKMGKISQEDFNILVDALETVGEVKKIEMDDQNAIFGRDNQISIVPFDLSAFFERKKKTEPRRLDPLSFYFSIQKNGDTIQIGVKPYVDFVGDKKAFHKIVNDMPNSGEVLDGVSVSLGQDNILVFSGMFIEKIVSTKEKIPVLGDIPLLGFAFQEKKEKLIRSELIIFLQPNVTDLSKENVF